MPLFNAENITDVVGLQAALNGKANSSDLFLLQSINWPGYASGRYYLSPLICERIYTNNGYFSINSLIFTGFPIFTLKTFDRIACKVNTAAASAKARLGIYSSLNGSPNTLILDSGELDCSSTGIKEAIINQSLNPGFYFVSMLLNNGSLAITQSNPYVHRGVSIYGVGLPGNENYGGLSLPYVYGTLPSTIPSTNIILNSYIPTIWLRST